MDADKTFRQTDFSRETDFKERLWRRLARQMQTQEEEELPDDMMEEVTAARAVPPKDEPWKNRKG